MVAPLLTTSTKKFVCKKLSILPPVVTEWQQSCEQPQCSHYCDGECRDSGRQSESAPCPMDAVDMDDAQLSQRCLATPPLPKKG